MKRGNRWIIIMCLMAGLAMPAVFNPFQLNAQRGGGGGAPGGGGQRGGTPEGGGFGGRGGQQAVPVDPNLPTQPTAVSIPTMSAEVTGPGAMYDSTTSLPPGKGLSAFGYEAKEYFVTGTAAKKPYKTRIVVRKPADRSKFSGLVLEEAMHPSGAAHMFEFTSTYLMSSGHGALEIYTAGLNEMTAQNKERYADIKVDNDQAPEILAQIGALAKRTDGNSPFGGLTVRKLVMGGTSATAAVLIRYLPYHMVMRTPEMKVIYDGFMPTSNGSTIQKIDVPLIHIPTMTEVSSGTITSRQDGDAPGDQYRIYEFAGMAHVDSRDSVRFKPDPCKTPASQFPLQAYFSVALNYLFDWVDKGKVPPRAERILLDLDTHNDGSLMALDEYGNARGGIRNPYVDVPVAKISVRNEAANPPVANPSAWIAAHGAGAPAQMCGLAGYQVAMPEDQLKKLYKNKNTYVDRVKRRLDELEKAGWSLPIYRETILADAAKVQF
jgi:hypothetical protein